MENLSGTNIKGYELRERIGAGGFGTVYRAYQSSVGREVAVKMILPHFANHPDFIRRFEAEAGLVARLEHPHIIPLHDYWRDATGAYLVMRWLRGGSLSEALKAGPYELRAADLLLDQVTSALSLAHRNDVVHRDLKPANILLDEDGNAYVADFGIAKDLSKLGATQADVVVGSPDYLSPEQVRSETVSPQTDIYSLGVMLYEVLTGTHPFPNATPVERMYKHLNDPLPSMTTLSPQVMNAVNAVIQRATAKDPVHRFADVLAMAAAFQEAAGLHRHQIGDSTVEVLTRREQEVLQRILNGQSNKQIAQELVITLGTAKWYVNQIYGKLHVRNRVQAIVRARELHLIANGNKATLVDVTAAPTDHYAPENPYKGLRAFQAADCQDFFGREVLTDRLVKRLGETGEMSRFLAVIGPSGSGKSSLVKAGLIPALWKGALPGSERWFVAEMLPGAHPLDELEIAVTRVASNPSVNLREQLERDERGLLRVAQLILPNDGSQLVLAIDQFEEVFTLLEEEQTRLHFLNLIREAVNDPRSRIRVVITLRADFYDRPLLYPEFGDLVRSRMETVLPLTAEGLERAITGPAGRVGAKFEPGLVASIVSEVNYQPGALPLLQYALTELFEHRQGGLLTHEAYQSIGGTAGALARRADEIYEGLDSEGQEAAHQMLLRLVTLGEGVEDTRRRVPRSELIAIAADQDTMDDIIDSYAAYRLLSLDHDPATRSPTIEVAHEAILREWKRLRGWLNESRHDIRMQRMLAAAAAEWRGANRDDSFLLRGSRLDQFQAWACDTKLALTQKERDYLDASLAERERQVLVEQKRQARETRLERRSRNFLRGLVALFVVASLVGFGLAAVAINQSQIAQRNAAESQNVALVAGSQAALANFNTDLAIALALQATTLDPTSTSAQIALGQAAYAPGTIRRFIGHTSGVNRVAFSPDGRTALSSSNDKTLILWDVQTGQIIRHLQGHTGSVNGVAFSPDGRTALSGSGDKTLILWDVQTGQIIRHFEGHLDSVNTVAISPDGRTALSGSGDKTLILWDVQTGQIIRHFETVNGHTNPVATIAISPDGHTALSGANETTLILWDISTGKVLRRFDGGQGWINGVAFSPDGRRALSMGADGTLVLWRLDTFQIIRRFQGHTNFGAGVAYSPDGHTALSASTDHTVRLWDLEGGQVIRHYVGHKDWVASLAFSPDGRKALSSSWDGNTVLWDVQTSKELYRVTDTEPTWSSNFSPDGHTVLIATGGFSSRPSDIIVLDVETGKEIRRLTGHPAGVLYVDLSPDGRTAISIGIRGAADGQSAVILWDVATGQQIRRFPAYEQDNTLDYGIAARFSPDGRTALTGFSNGKIILWDVATAQEIRRFDGQTNLVSNMLFSPDGRTFVSSSLDNTVIQWDVATGEIIHRLTDHSAAVYRMALSPDGRFAFAGSGDNTSILWDLKTGQAIRRFILQTANTSASFSPDSRSILVGLEDGTLQMWRIDTLDEMSTWIRGNRYVPDLDCRQRQLYRLTPGCDASGVFPTTPFDATAKPTSVLLQ